MATLKTHCSHGHEYTADNTYFSKQGHRICRACKLRSVAASHARNHIYYTPIKERFWSLVEKGDSCWLYTADPSQRYPRVPISKTKSIKASRFSYELTHGTIATNMLVCHTCDTPRCVNPAHLFLGTHADNARDKISKGRGHEQGKTHCKNGHEFTPENTRMVRGKHRACRICLSAQSNGNKARNQANNRRRLKAAKQANPL